jgi:Zn-dependent protease
MLPRTQGSYRVLRLFGVDVFVHWSWLVVGFLEVQYRQADYRAFLWNVLEYLALFCIVLLHEFGHALACRQVGGVANQIVLWPLGGVAYVAPPQRPGAMLWSIAAGPLVNVALVPILGGALLLGQFAGWPQTLPDLYRFLFVISFINGGLLVFNMLPVYPLDGGQILRSLLWYFLGRARSLMVATVIGFIGVAALVPLIIKANSFWYYIVAAFVVMNLWQGMKQALVLSRVEKLPRHQGFACPHCRTAPPAGGLWTCANCRNGIDLFAVRGICPHCGAQYATVACPECSRTSALAEWSEPAPGPSSAP